MKKVIGLVPVLALVLLAGCTMNKINEGYLKERPGYTDFATPIYARGTVVGFGALAGENAYVPGTKFVAVRYYVVAYKDDLGNVWKSVDYLVRYAIDDTNAPLLKAGQEVSLGFIVMKNSEKQPMHSVSIRKAVERVMSVELPTLANMETAPLMYLNVTAFIGLNDPPHSYSGAVTPTTSK